MTDRQEDHKEQQSPPTQAPQANPQTKEQAPAHPGASDGNAGTHGRPSDDSDPGHS